MQNIFDNVLYVLIMGIVISKQTFVCLFIVSLYIVLDFDFEYVSVQGWCPMWLMSSAQASLISWGGVGTSLALVGHLSLLDQLRLV